VFSPIPHASLASDTQGVVNAKTAMLPTAVVNPKVLLYAAQHNAPLPADGQAEVLKRRAQAEALAACFQKAVKHADLAIPGQHAELWGAMHDVQRDHVKSIAEKAAFWVQK
jgi:hypothetical protein